MELQEWIELLEYDHKYVICVWCNNFTAQILNLDFSHRIHRSPLCNYIKSTSIGMSRCIRYRNSTEYFACKGKRSGICPHGLYELAQPVFSENKHIATVFIGNLLKDPEKSEAKLKRSCLMYGISFNKAKKLLYQAESSFDEDILAKTASVIATMTSEKISRFHHIQNEKFPEPIKYIINNLIYEDPLPTLNDLAKRLGYNDQYLGRLFKQHVGISFNEYLNRIKLQNAVDLILDGNIKIIDAALASGFNDVTYFSRVFRKRYGMSPQEYRKNHRKL